MNNDVHVCASQCICIIIIIATCAHECVHVRPGYVYLYMCSMCRCTCNTMLVCACVFLSVYSNMLIHVFVLIHKESSLLWLNKPIALNIIVSP